MHISQKQEIFKEWFLDDFCLVFHPLSNSIVGFEFFVISFFVDPEIC